MSTNYDKSNLKAKDSSEQSLIEMSISNGVEGEMTTQSRIRNQNSKFLEYSMLQL